MATRSGIRQRFCNDERRLNSKFAYETMELSVECRPWVEILQTIGELRR